MGQTNFYEKNYHNCWPPVTTRDIADPNSEYWRSEAYLSMHIFDRLPIPQEDWLQWRTYFDESLNVGITWKKVHEVYEMARKKWAPGLTPEELAHRVEILPEVIHE